MCVQGIKEKRETGDDTMKYVYVGQTVSNKKFNNSKTIYIGRTEFKDGNLQEELNREVLRETKRRRKQANGRYKQVVVERNTRHRQEFVEIRRALRKLYMEKVADDTVILMLHTRIKSILLGRTALPKDLESDYEKIIDYLVKLHKHGNLLLVGTVPNSENIPNLSRIGKLKGNKEIEDFHTEIISKKEPEDWEDIIEGLLETGVIQEEDVVEEEDNEIDEDYVDEDEDFDEYEEYDDFEDTEDMEGMLMETDEYEIEEGYVDVG